MCAGCGSVVLDFCCSLRSCWCCFGDFLALVRKLKFLLQLRTSQTKICERFSCNVTEKSKRSALARPPGVVAALLHWWSVDLGVWSCPPPNRCCFLVHSAAALVAARADHSSVATAVAAPPARLWSSPCSCTALASLSAFCSFRRQRCFRPFAHLLLRLCSCFALVLRLLVSPLLAPAALVYAPCSWAPNSITLRLRDAAVASAAASTGYSLVWLLVVSMPPPLPLRMRH